MMINLFDIEGKVIVITGGYGAPGKSIAFIWWNKGLR